MHSLAAVANCEKRVLRTLRINELEETFQVTLLELTQRDIPQ